MLQRFKRALEAGRDAVQQADTVQVETSAPAPVAIDTPKDANPSTPPKLDPVLALLVLDELGPAAPEVIRKHLAAAKSARARALFIVSAPSEMDVFSDRSLLCEYVPSHQEIFRATEERPDVISLYRQHRLQLILDKWRVQDCHWIGESADDLIKSTKTIAQRPVRFKKA